MGIGDIDYFRLRTWVGMGICETKGVVAGFQARHHALSIYYVMYVAGISLSL